MGIQEYIQKEISPCHKCGITSLRKVVDIRDRTSNIMLISEGPGYTESRTGIPFTGADEILVSQCGACENLVACFSWFLRATESYKENEVPCKYPDGNIERVDDDRFRKRLQTLRKLIAFDRNKKYHPRTAGQLLDDILIHVGLFRDTHVEYLRLCKEYGVSKSDPLGSVTIRQLTDKDLESDTLVSREDIYLTNIIACRAYLVEKNRINNREPEDDEIDNCAPHLRFLIQAVSPKVIIAPGVPALCTLTGKSLSISKAKQLAGEKGYILSKYNIPLIPCYHPSALIRWISKDKDRYNKGVKIMVEQIRLAKEVGEKK
jgi:uracil-DNA glycosylase family 4